MACSLPQKDVFPLECKAMVDHLSSTIHRNNRPTTISCLTCFQNITCYSQKDVTNHMCEISLFSPNSITTSRPINNAGSIDKNSGTVLIDWSEKLIIDSCDFKIRHLLNPCSGKIMSSYHIFISDGSYSGWVEWVQ